MYCCTNLTQAGDKAGKKQTDGKKINLTFSVLEQPNPHAVIEHSALTVSRDRFLLKMDTLKQCMEESKQF